MKGSRASKRYAGALLELATELKRVDKIAADMKLVRDTTASSRELELFFSSPVIDKSKKRAVVKALYGGKADKLTVDFLNLLIDKGREKLATGIAVEFGKLLDDMMGIVDAELRSPFALDDKGRTKIGSVLEKLTKKRVRVSFSLDESLVGGFLAQIGDTVYDGSVRRQLEILKDQLSGESAFGA